MILRFIFFLATLIAGFPALAQRVTLLCEGFGDGGSYVAITDYSGWDNPDAVFEGTGRIGNTKSHICTLPESSKRGYLYFSSDNIKDMTLRKLNIAGYSDVKLSYNLKKSKASSGDLLVEVYVDGQKVVSYHPELKNTTGWFSVPIRSIPAGNVMDLHLSNDDTGVTLYIDDLLITGIPDVPAVPDKPVMTPAAGLYTEPVSLTLTASPESRIYYTLDGTDPTEESELYLSPVTLERTATVTAIAVSDAGQSDPVSAKYEIVPVATVPDLDAFRKAEGEVRLNLNQAEVVDVDADGIYVQTVEGGLLLPSGALAAVRGDRLDGFIIGRPQVRNGMTGVADGIFSQLVVTPGTMDPVPLSVNLSEALLHPERYAACFLQLEGVSYSAENAGVYLWGDSQENSLRVRTGEWSQDEAWKWPEKMTLQGVLKGDEGGFYLWVSSAKQVLSADTQLAAEPLGTALVTTERDGTRYALQTRISKEGLLCTPVAVLHGQAVASAEDASDLLWDIRESGGYLRSLDGQYLQGASSGTGLKWADSPDASCEWYRDEEDGYWVWKKDSRALFRSDASGIIKNYSLSNLENSIYSLKPAVDLPLFAGYLREQTPGRWGTLCVPYAVNEEDFAGGLFFEIEGRLDDEEGSTRSIVLAGPVDHLEAGVPYILYAESSALVLLYAGEPVATPLSRNGLQGTFEGVNPDKDAEDAALDGKYVFSNNVLRKCLPGSSVGENKAYVDLSKVPLLEEMPSGALRIQVNPELAHLDELTAETLADAPVYTVEGVYKGIWTECKENLKKGIYIVSGNKIIIK